MMLNLIRLLKENPDVVTIVGNDYLYFRGYSGDYQLSVNGPQKYSCIVLTAKYKNDSTLPSVELHDEYNLICSSKNDQNLIIRISNDPKKFNHKTSIESIYYPICAIMKDIKSTYDPILEIEAVVKLVNARRKIIHQCTALSKILLQVEKNSSKQNFNLDSLCKIVYMSRRKVQYLLKSSGLCFRDVLARDRLSNISNLIVENSSMSLELLAKKSGFSSLCTANKALYKFKGVNLKTYRNGLKNNHHC